MLQRAEISLSHPEGKVCRGEKAAKELDSAAGERRIYVYIYIYMYISVCLSLYELYEVFLRLICFGIDSRIKS